MWVLTTEEHEGYTDYLVNGHDIGLWRDSDGWGAMLTTATQGFFGPRDALTAMRSHWEAVAARYKRRCPAQDHALGKALTYQMVAELFPAPERSAP